jgi:hypothetical protein
MVAIKQIEAKPKTTIFGNSHTAQGFPPDALEAINAIDLFYRSSGNLKHTNDLSIICHMSQQKAYDWLFIQIMKIRHWMNFQGFRPEFTAKERSEGDKEESLSFLYQRIDKEGIGTSFSVKIKLQL